jgi:hypothetical protein
MGLLRLHRDGGVHVGVVIEPARSVEGEAQRSAPLTLFGFIAVHWAKDSRGGRVETVVLGFQFLETSKSCQGWDITGGLVTKGARMWRDGFFVHAACGRCRSVATVCVVFWLLIVKHRQRAVVSKIAPRFIVR